MNAQGIDFERRADTEDQEYLAGLNWRPGTCAFCRASDVQVVEVGHIEQGTLPGYPLLMCRRDAAYELTLRRAEANNRGDFAYKPDLRRR